MQLDSVRELKAVIQRKALAMIARAAAAGRNIALSAQPMAEVKATHRTFARRKSSLPRERRLLYNARNEISRARTSLASPSRHPDRDARLDGGPRRGSRRDLR